LGALTTISGEMPHPNGKVVAGYILDKGKWKININLPQKTTGILVWQAKQYILKAGANSFVI
jgi:alpha-L-rhamnosidase